MNLDWKFIITIVIIPSVQVFLNYYNNRRKEQRDDIKDFLNLVLKERERLKTELDNCNDWYQKHSNLILDLVDKNNQLLAENRELKDKK
jgi:hypothetical protein